MKNKGALLAFSIIGLSITVAAILNDVGAVTIFSMLGATYGYSTIWELFVMAIVLAIVQEMISRMAVVTGKGLSDLIREKFGVKWTFFVMNILFISSMCSAVANFSGIAQSLEIFGISKYIGIPLIVFLIWIMLVKNNYGILGKILLAVQICILSYVALIIVLKPNFSYIAIEALVPKIQFSSMYFIMMLAVIGAVITPYMQFYMQYSFLNRSIPLKDYGYEKIAVYMGSIIALIIDFFIVVCAFEVLGKKNIGVTTVYNLSSVFSPLFDKYYIIFGIVMFSVSILGCFIIPLCTALSICEAFGFESGEENKIKDAPVFFGIFIFIILVSAIIVLIPGGNFLNTILITETVSGVLSSVIFIFIIKIASDPEVMGSKVNRSIQNFIVWIFVFLTSVALIDAGFLKIFT
ncbi:divalent metal cation transporter [Clostridium sp. cel8]|jgi:Mn2+/Fe2+ NRAMP family transporter|uniref:NRAMP family divalent metal transporter n=1 Tax=unclassified Clostridium TaxID=2614128 RepID=UPI0015F48398|nr:divalent metal cation transporter [Clostridium sp. cel8]MBA5851352.1 divalent metal cation transporter [Clostridium sp. cel8]